MNGQELQEESRADERDSFHEADGESGIQSGPGYKIQLVVRKSKSKIGYCVCCRSK